MYDYADRLASHLNQRLAMCNELKTRAELYQQHLREH